MLPPRLTASTKNKLSLFTLISDTSLQVNFKTFPIRIYTGASIPSKPMMHIPPYFRKFFNFPLFSFFSFSVSPYFDHNAFRHHALQKLDAPEYTYAVQTNHKHYY